MNVLPAPSDSWWVAIAIGAVWKSVVVLACAGMLVLALRRSSAAARHLVWSLALAGTLVLPLMTVALPSWAWPVLPAAAVATVPEIKRADDAGATISPGPIAFDGSSGQGGSDEGADDATRTDRALATHSGSATAVAAASVPAFSIRGPRSPHIWVLGVWLAGASLVLGGPLLGRLFLLSTKRGAAPIDPGEWAELARTTSEQLGLRRRVTILRSNRAAMPVTWGWIRPVVLLPSGADDWPRERRHDVLLHELAHVRRLDCLTQSVAQMACAVYWFNPLAWLAARHMRIERERACDDIVLLAGSSASDYAAHLLEIARGLRGHRLTALAAVAMAQPGPFEGRLLAILDPKRRRSGISYRSAALVTAALIGGLIPLAAVRVVAHGATAIRTPASQVAGERQRDAAPSPRMTVTGLVVDQRGAPVPNADVMIYTQPKVFERPTLFHAENPLVIGKARTDGSGRFRIDAPRTSSSTHDLLALTALAPGHGIGWVKVDPDAEEPTATIALRPEFVIQGRLFDVQGQPARGVKVVVASINRYSHGELEGPVFVYDHPPEPPPAWPQPATTDAGGHFTLRGVGRELLVGVAVDDARFASQLTFVETGGPVDTGLPPGILRPIVKLDTKPEPSKLTLALEPAQIITGRVTYADSGKPVPHAPLFVASQSDSRRRGGTSRLEADSEGRFRINPPSGDHYFLWTQSPNGQPYLAVVKTLDWPKGAVEQAVDFALPRGVVITGKITELGSGKPVAGAVVQFTPYNTLPRPSHTQSAPSLSSSDGSFQVADEPGPGYVVVQGPSDDYVLREMGAEGTASHAKPGSWRFYAHAYTFLDLKPASTGQEVNLTIQRGLTVKVRVLGPDDRPVQDALVLSRIVLKSIPSGGWKMWSGHPRGHAREGRFELHGLDPDTEVPVYFLDSQHELGATIHLSGKSAGAGPVTVRLEHCGTARARLVDSGGKPVKGQGVQTSMIVTPGVIDSARERNPGRLVSNGELLSRLDPNHYRTDPVSDARGQIDFPALIPGATYRIIDFSTFRTPEGNQIRKEFSVKPGETLELGDILIAKPAL